MSRDEAVKRLLEIAKADIDMLDGEWGCCHSYDEAVAASYCTYHSEAVEVEALERVLLVGE